MPRKIDSTPISEKVSSCLEIYQMQSFREILKRIVYQRNAVGKIIEQRAAASSINLPAIDEQKTRKQICTLDAGTAESE